MQSRADMVGAGGSSAALGGISSLSSQFGANLGYGSMMSGLSQQYSGFTGQAAQFGAQAQLGGAVAGLAGQVYGFGQQFMQNNPQPNQAPLPNPTNTATGLPQVY